jgi:hypothetical protein
MATRIGIGVKTSDRLRRPRVACLQPIIGVCIHLSTKDSHTLMAKHTLLPCQTILASRTPMCSHTLLPCHTILASRTLRANHTLLVNRTLLGS